MSTDQRSDVWSAWNHKVAMATQASTRTLAPEWVPEDDRRRIVAYMLGAGYANNDAARFIDTTDQTEIDEYMQMGDVPVMINRKVGGVMGDSVRPMVHGAQRPPLPRPQLDPRPTDPGDDASDLEREVHEAVLERWEAEQRDRLARWREEHRVYPILRGIQSWFDEWWELVQFALLMYELESESTHPKGDGILAYWLNKRARRPMPRIYPPDSYFPVLEGADRGQYPTTVHFVWEEEHENLDGVTEVWMRRITYSLEPIATKREWDPGRRPNSGRWVNLYDPQGRPIPPLGSPRERVVQDPDAEPDGITAWVIERDQPWGPEYETCYYTEATWRWDASHEWTAYDPLPEGVTPTHDRVDLDWPFVPVVHYPHTPASVAHFGKSAIGPVSQVADELAASAQDLAKGSSLAATPMVTASNVNVDSALEVEPGAILPLGADGSMDTLDLSSAIEPLIKYDDHLIERFDGNSEVTAPIMGRVPTQSVAGIALKLQMGPFEHSSAVARLTREPKDALAMKMAFRIAWKEGAFDELLATAGTDDSDDDDDGPAVMPTVRIGIARGAITPADLGAIRDLIKDLLPAGAMSRDTAVALLISAGVAIEDARDEVEKIAAIDFEGAKKLGEAIGGFDEVADYLGLQIDVDEDDGDDVPPVLNF